MADLPAFLSYKAPVEGAEPSPTENKAKQLLKLLPDIKDQARKERVMAWLDDNGYGDEMLRAAPTTTTVGKQYDLAEQPFTKPTLSEAATRLAGKYDEATLGRLRSGDLGALDALRPTDRRDVEQALKARETAAQEPAAHAPMESRPGGLARELDARASEQAPVSRSRSGQPQQEFTHTPGERAVALTAQPAAGAMKGLHYSTGRLSELPARMFPGADQAMLDELAETSSVTKPVAVVASALPVSMGSKVAGAAARMIPEVAAAPGLMNMGLRGAAGLGRATLAGGAAGAVDAGGAALNEVAEGMPVSEVPGMMAQGAAEAVPAALAMYPFFAGMQKLGRSAVDDLRQSPSPGPQVLALDDVFEGRPTQVPLFNRNLSMRSVRSELGPPTLLDELADTGRAIPGKMPFTRQSAPPPIGNELAAQAREQQASGRAARREVGDRVGGKAIGQLSAEQQATRAAHNEANQAMYEDLEYGRTHYPGSRVTSEPVAEHLMKLAKKGKFDDDSPLPGVGGEVAEVEAMLNDVATVRWAKPGEAGLDPEGVKALGFRVPAAPAAVPEGRQPGASYPPRAPGDTVPPPRARKGGGGVIIEAKEFSAEQLEKTIDAMDDIASAEANVKKKGKALMAEGIGAVLRGMRNSYRTWHGGRAGQLGPGPDLRAEGPDVKGGPISSSFARTKRAHGEDWTALEDRMRSLGLNVRAKDLRPEDANQLNAVVSKIMSGDPALRKIFPDNTPEHAALRDELRVSAARVAFDDLFGVSAPAQPNLVASPSGPHGILSLGGSARLAFDPIARGLAGANASPDVQRGLAGSRAGRVAPRVDPETVNRFLAMIGLGSEAPKEER